MFTSNMTAAGLLLAEVSDALSLSLWIMLAAVLALGGFYVASAIKRWTRREVRTESFTLQDLRELRASNDITEEEYHALRAGLLGRLADSSAGDPEPPEPPDPAAPENPNP